MTDARFEELVGKTLVRAENLDSERIEFDTADRYRFSLFHSQDCCESVRVEEIVGDLSDLVGGPILLAEEVSNAEGPAPEYADSYTWTFYKLATNKGSVTIRWLGESNGYYSEGVDFVRELLEPRQ